MPEQAWHDNVLTWSENHSVILSENDLVILSGNHFVILSLSKDLYNPEIPRYRLA